MILTRAGAKAKPAAKIASFFPSKIDGYLETHFGGGSMLFHLLDSPQKPAWAAVNDLDTECHNLWQCFFEEPEKVKADYESLFYCEATFLWLKTNIPIDRHARAARFLALSNWGYLGGFETMSIQAFNNNFLRFERAYESLLKILKNVTIAGRPTDAVKFLEDVSIKHAGDTEKRVFVYCDPPYLNTDQGGYKTPKWEEADLVRLFDALQSKSWKWALSEFDHPFVLAEAEKRGLFIHTIGERINIKNRRTEILITNYEPQVKTLF